MADKIRKMDANHTVDDIDRTIDEVSDAIGDAQSLSARLAEKLDISDIDSALSTESENPVQNKAVAGAVSALADCGAKNQLMNNAVTKTVNGITFTVNTDGTFTANGTATATAILILNTFSNLNLSNGDYILTGCPECGSSSSYRLDITRTPGSSINDIGNGASFAVGSSYTLNEIRCVILKDTVCDNLSFEPMIRRAELPAGYQPYAPTNRQLYEMILAVSGNQVQSTAQLMASSNSEEETR